MVAELLDVEAPLADSAAEGRDQGADLRTREHLVEPSSLDVQDLASKRQNCLKLPVAPLFRRAAGTVALDDVELSFARVSRLAIGQLARQCGVVELPFSHDLAGFACRLASF